MGNGGRLRGSPRWPSKRLDQGRLLAADVGPRSHVDLDVEVETLRPARCSGPGASSRAAGGALAPRARGGRCIRREVDDPVPGAEAVGGDGHALEHQVGMIGEDHAVLECARLAFVGVADDVFLFAWNWRPGSTWCWWGSRPRRGPAARIGRSPRSSAGCRAMAAARPLPGSIVENVRLLRSWSWRGLRGVPSRP